MGIEEILKLELGTMVIYTCENFTESRVIGEVLGKFSAISDYGAYMPLNTETYSKHKYTIKVV